MFGSSSGITMFANDKSSRQPSRVGYTFSGRISLGQSMDWNDPTLS